MVLIIQNKTNVVFKIYDRDQLTSHKMKALRNEITILKKIDHPNVIKLYDVIEDKKSIMLAMEYIPGGSLKDYLKRKSNKKISEVEARKYFGQIIDALRYLHWKQIYHRDLKLENILLDYKKDIKIIDFGYSIICEPEDQLSIFWGTTPYMAPEIIKKEKYWGHHVDIWAVGVITYTMLMGSLPFNGKTEEDLFKKICWGQYRNPPGISFDWKRLLSQIFNMDPMRRPSASELFYDSWNSGYFQDITCSNRKNSNQSSMKLTKNFQHVQHQKNWFATTQKKAIHRRARD